MSSPIRLSAIGIASFVFAFSFPMLLNAQEHKEHGEHAKQKTPSKVTVVSEEAHIKRGKTILATVKEGDTLRVSVQKGDWYGVMFHDTKGWIHKKHVRAGEAAHSEHEKHAEKKHGEHKENAEGKHAKKEHGDDEHGEAKHAKKEHGEHEEHGEAKHAKKGHEEHGEHGHGKAVEFHAPESYSGGLKQVAHRMGAIAELIEHGKLDEVHAQADVIRKIAQKLPGLAAKKGSGVERDDLVEITRAAKALADTFGAIDEAADAGKMAETKEVYANMKGLAASLRKHAKAGHDEGHGEEKEHHKGEKEHGDEDKEHHKEGKEAGHHKKEHAEKEHAEKKEHHKDKEHEDEKKHKEHEDED
jgi:hypothetical protein